MNRVKVLVLFLVFFPVSAWGTTNIGIYYEPGAPDAADAAEDICDVCALESSYNVMETKRVKICDDADEIDPNCKPILVFKSRSDALGCAPLTQEIIGTSDVVNADMIHTYTLILYNGKRVKDAESALNKSIVIVKDDGFDPIKTRIVLSALREAFIANPEGADTELTWSKAKINWKTGKLDVIAVTVPSIELDSPLTELLIKINSDACSPRLFVPFPGVMGEFCNLTGGEYFMSTPLTSNVEGFSYVKNSMITDHTLMEGLRENLPWWVSKPLVYPIQDKHLADLVYEAAAMYSKELGRPEKSSGLTIRIVEKNVKIGKSEMPTFNVEVQHIG